MLKKGPMPVLEHIKGVFQAEFGPDFSKLPNRDNTLFVIIQHGFMSIRPMMEAFLELGIDSDQVFMTTKPHTTPTNPEDMLSYFKHQFKHYVPFQWTTTAIDSQETVKKSRYKVLTDATHDKLFEEFCNYLIRYPDLPNRRIENIIICDEGGKFLSKFIERYHRPSSTARRNLNDYHVVAIEHTKCGTYRPELNHLPFPLINMADSYLKTQVESQFIAESMFVHLNAVLEKIMHASSMIIGVVGGGNIGKEVLVFLSEQYASIPVIIFDKESSVLSSSEITALGWNNIRREKNIEVLFQQATVILGCTGKDFMADLSVDCFLKNQASHIHLVSCSSSDTEFNTLLQKMPDYKFESLTDIRDYSMPIDIMGEKLITLYNGGFPMNFLIEQPAGVPVEETVPWEQVQITRSMKLAAIVQALKLLEVTAYFPKQYDNSLKDYMKLEVFYQWEILQAFHHHLMTNNPHTQRQIAEGSMGVHQPTMSSVLNIPYYITTQHQVKMQSQLLKQNDVLIKRLVIHGTTGSGKTTLAQHYLQKHRMQHPEHLTRTIAAETTLQWRDHLRTWAEELFPELRTLLFAETNPQRQESLIDQRLQAALSGKEWCVVIDNWDQDQLLFKRIEDLLLGSQVSKGILLITTQGESPYADSDHSIDLSLGLTEEESQKLLIKVMNLEKTNGLTWEQLGSEAELASLTDYLNRLPLALVVAGSYLLWENKSLPHNASTRFTYSNYKKLLVLQVTELIRIHKEKLGKKGDIPREASEEFIRIKTQEAAVDLSLKKAIKTDSSNPNMNLWQMLCFCGFLASDHIPQQILKDYIEQILSEDEREIYITFFEMLLSEAQKYSLLQFERRQSTVDSLQSLHIHRVIQKVLRDNYWPNLLETLSADKIALTKKMMRKSLGTRFLLAVEKSSFLILRAYLQQVTTWCTYWENDWKELKIIDELKLFSTLAQAHAWLHNYAQAETLYREILNTPFIRAAKQTTLVIKIKENLAVMLSHLGRYQEAEGLNQEALAERAAKNLCSAETQLNLAASMHERGQYRKANSLLQEVLVTEKSSNSLVTSKIKGGLAISFRALGESKRADELQKESIAEKIAHYGQASKEGQSILRLDEADTFRKLKDYDKAKNIYQEELAARIALYGGEDHVKVAEIQEMLAETLINLTNYKGAEILYIAALITRKKCSTETHISVLQTEGYLANLYHRMGASEKADVLYQKVLQGEIDHYSASHIKVSFTQEALAKTAASLGRYSEAVILIRKALATTIEHYKPMKNVRVAKMQLQLATHLLQLGKLQEALHLIEDSEKIFQAQEGEATHENSCHQLKRTLLVVCEVERRAYSALTTLRYSEAIVYFEKLIQQCPGKTSYYHNIARTYHLWGMQTSTDQHFDKAKQNFEQALRLEKNLNSLVEYSNFLRERDQYSTAIVLLNEALIHISDNSDELSYGLGEAPTLPSDFAEKIKTDGKIVIHHPQFFAYYLKIQCLLAQMPIQSEIIITCLRNFIEFVDQFKHNHADSYLPIYDWFLKNACELSERQSFLAHDQVDERGEGIRLSSVVSTLHPAPRNNIFVSVSKPENGERTSTGSSLT